MLVDAPCSGSGTLRRHPEIRWRLTPERIALLSAQQGRILDHAARIVAPGGTILYSVCSVERKGEEVVERFLARHPELVRAQARLSGPARELVDPEGALRTSPPLHGMDGFYAVAMTRAAAQGRG